MNKIYQLAIVEDHPVVIEGLSALLPEPGHLEIIACFQNATSLLEYRQLNKIDILLMDVFLPDMNGIDLCAKVKKLHPGIIVLAISSQSERSIVLQMIRNGANGYLLKSASREEFKFCINLAIDGKMALSNDVKDIVQKTNLSDLKMVPRLTRREKEIVQLLIKGKSTQEISDELFLSYLTVQTHRRNLLHKYQVKNLVELLNLVHANSLV